MSAFGLTKARTNPDGLAATVERALASAGEVILGKESRVRLAIACLLAGGHLLIEDIPGVGKTTLAQVLARILGLDFQRIQFTSDLLPADILGVSIYDRTSGGFEFHPGPIFTQLVFADEVNRATPKAQSALLEAMEEHQVTQDGKSRRLPEPFFVIATQNPANQIGTFPLPESQLDRFLMRIEVGYPPKAAERALLQGRDRRERLSAIEACFDPAELLAIQSRVGEVFLSDALLDYVQSFLQHTRTSPDFQLGLSPRAGLAITRASQAWALMEDRDHVVPEDVQAVLPSVIAHRLHPRSDPTNHLSNAAVDVLMERVPIP